MAQGQVVENGDIFVDRARVVANTSYLKPYTGDYTVQGDFLVVRNAVDNFLKIRNRVYELTSESGNIGFYRQVAATSGKYVDNVVIKPEATNAVLGLNVLKDIARPLETAENLTQEELATINEQHFECQ